jgi:hypothetical protein
VEIEMTIKNLAQKAGLIAAFVLGGTAASLAASASATTDVHVRTGPGTQYGVVDTLFGGENVDVLGCRSGWCQIRHSGPDGWVSANYLARGGYYEPPPQVIIRRPLPPPPRYYRPYHRHHHHGGYWGHQPRIYNHGSFCIGGNHASFCLNG